MESSLCRSTILALTILTVSGHAAVIVSTTGNCASPPSSPITGNDADAGPTSASASTNIDCIFGGENTGFAHALSSGSILGSTHLDLSVIGAANADTGFLLVPGREDAFQDSQSNSNVDLDLLVTGGAPAGILRVTASNCQMLAGIFGEFRVNGASEQNLTGCAAGTQVFAPYTRDVPFQISWFLHAEAFSTISMQADDTGQYTFDTFELLTTSLDPNTGASLTLLPVPEPPTAGVIGAGMVLLAARLRKRRPTHQ